MLVKDHKWKFKNTAKTEESQTCQRDWGDMNEYSAYNVATNTHMKIDNFYLREIYLLTC